MSQPILRHSRGQAVAEFALVLPVLLLLLFGVFELGRFIFAYETLNSAVREGVRYAIVHGSQSTCPSGPPAAGSYACDPSGANVVGAVDRYAFGLDKSSLIVTVCWGANCPVQGVTNIRDTPVTVTARYTWHPVVNFVFLPAIVVQGTSTDVVNY